MRVRMFSYLVPFVPQNYFFYQFRSIQPSHCLVEFADSENQLSNLNFQPVLIVVGGKGEIFWVDQMAVERVE